MNDTFKSVEATADNVASFAEKEAALQKLEGAKDHANHIADEVKGAARDLGDAAKYGASALRDAASSRARTTKVAARNQYESSRQDFESRVRREPLKYVGISFGIGFFLGWLTKD